MTLPVAWHPRARRDLAQIVDYIRLRSPSGATRILEAIEDSVEMLPSHPYAFRMGRIPGTRECIAHPSYFYVYRVDLENITILRVLHTQQQYPPA